MGFLDAFVPDEAVGSVSEIDLDALAARGIEGLLLDLDNTLLAHGTLAMTADRAQWARRAAERFSCCLLSNSVRGRRVRRLSGELGVPGIAVWHWGRKPLSGGFRRAMSITGTSPEQTAMIGDQLLSDILGGNRTGLHTIWVERIDPCEFVVTRHVHRPIETWIARRLERAGLIPDPRADATEAGDEQ